MYIVDDLKEILDRKYENLYADKVKPQLPIELRSEYHNYRFVETRYPVGGGVLVIDLYDYNKYTIQHIIITSFQPKKTIHVVNYKDSEDGIKEQRISFDMSKNEKEFKKWVKELIEEFDKNVEFTIETIKSLSVMKKLMEAK
jgi:predicted RNA-binding protein Jag